MILEMLAHQISLLLYVHLIGDNGDDNEDEDEDEDDDDDDDNEEQDCWSSPSLISECVRANLSNRDVSYWGQASPSFLQNQSAHDDDDDYHNHSNDDDDDDDDDDCDDDNDHCDDKDCETFQYFFIFFSNAKCNCWI